MGSERSIFSTISPTRLQAKVDQYFDLIKKRKNVPSLSGLAMHLNCTRFNLVKYKNTDDYGPIIQKAKLRCENYLEERMIAGVPPTGLIFILKNNYGWNDKVEVENKFSGSISLMTLFKQASEQKKIAGSKQEIIDGEIIETPTTESIFDSNEGKTSGEPIGSPFVQELPDDLF